MMVTEADECPESHPEPVFSRKYYGSDAGCSCIGVWPEIKFKDRFGRARTVENTKNKFTISQLCSAEDLAAGCENVAAIPEVQMTEMAGKRVCGKRASFNFRDAVRPSPVSG